MAVLLLESVGNRVGVDMHLRAAGSEKLGFPGGGIGSAGDDHALGFKCPEHRQLGKRFHAGGCFIPRLLQDIHR